MALLHPCLPHHFQVFVSGIVDTMSTLTFWSYTSQFPFIFTPALAIGEVSKEFSHEKA